MEEKVNLTALLSAYGRAYYSQRARRPIFYDLVARKLFLSDEWREIYNRLLSGAAFFAPEKTNENLSADELVTFAVNEQIAPNTVFRSAYCEKSLETAILSGVRQYVILGSGLDTFAFRKPLFLENGLEVFEVDRPQSICDKKERLKKASLDIPRGLRFVPCDLKSENLKEKLFAAGFNEQTKSFFSMLGLSYYLAEDDFVNVLRDIFEICPQGSLICFDYADEKLFSGDDLRVKNTVALAAAAGEPMKLCFSEKRLVKTLENAGFLLYENLKDDEISSVVSPKNKPSLRPFKHINYALAAVNPIKKQCKK